jgi:hypothetical protein
MIPELLDARNRDILDFFVLGIGLTEKRDTHAQCAAVRSRVISRNASLILWAAGAQLACSEAPKVPAFFF